MHLPHQFLKRQNCTAIRNYKCLSIGSVGKGERSRGAPVEREILCLLHLVHMHVAVAGIHATAFYVRSLFRLENLARRIVVYRNKPQGLVLLIRFSDCAVRAANFSALAVNLGCYAQIAVQRT